MRKKKLMMRFYALGCIAALGVGAFSFPVHAQTADGIDYILGRPMTLEEIQKMKTYEPKNFPVMDSKLVTPKYEKVTRTRSMVADSTLPSYFSLVEQGKVTSVKNQDKWGTCWTFGACASMESHILTSHQPFLSATPIAKDALDLSERHLAYFTFHNFVDPLGGLAGDSSNMTGESYLKFGYDSRQAAMALASWKGIVDEKKAPYQDILGVPDSNIAQYDLDPSLAYQHDATLMNFKAVNMSDRNSIKKLLTTEGAAAVSYHWNPNNHNYSTGAYYQSEKENLSHCVTIVGWDDNYSRTNFKQHPDADGAWLIKNSWGTGWGNQGYFWLSYEDATVNASSDNSAYFYQAQPKSNYDNNYQHDGTNVIWNMNLTSGGSIANRFQVPYNTKNQSLKAVSFAVNNTDVNYTVKIYKNCSETNPTSGQEMYAAQTTGSIDYSGYYTIPLNQTVDLYPGETFSVVIELTSNKGENTLKPFIDGSYTYAKTAKGTVQSYTNTARAGESFYRSSAKYSWTDYSKSYQKNFRIKAFTVNK